MDVKKYVIKQDFITSVVSVQPVKKFGMIQAVPVIGATEGHVDNAAQDSSYKRIHDR